MSTFGALEALSIYNNSNSNINTSNSNNNKDTSNNNNNNNNNTTTTTTTTTTNNNDNHDSTCGAREALSGPQLRRAGRDEKRFRQLFVDFLGMEFSSFPRVFNVFHKSRKPQNSVWVVSSSHPRDEQPAAPALGAKDRTPEVNVDLSGIFQRVSSGIIQRTFNDIMYYISII